MAPQCPADFQRALDGCVRCRRKYESYAVSGCNSNQFTGGFRTPKRLGVSDYLIKVLEQLMLLIDQSFRIPDDVYEQDMGNLQSKIGFRFGHKVPTVLLTEERATLNGDRTPDAQMIKVYRLGNNIVRDPSTALRMIKSCQGGELNSRPTPKAFGAALVLQKINRNTRVFLSFQYSLHPSCFFKGGNSLQAAMARFSPRRFVVCVCPRWC